MVLLADADAIAAKRRNLFNRNALFEERTKKVSLRRWGWISFLRRNSPFVRFSAKPAAIAAFSSFTR
jgi:hypothetical protein